MPAKLATAATNYIQTAMIDRLQSSLLARVTASNIEQCVVNISLLLLLLPSNNTIHYLGTSSQHNDCSRV